MARLPLRCTHSPQREVWHRGPKDRSPCLEMARLCLSCRQVARSLGMNLRWPDGSPWFEPWTAQPLALPVVDGPPVLLPSTGGEEGLPLPVEVEHSVPDEKKTCKAEEGCDRPVKAKGYCGSHYEKVFRRNGRGKVERPVAPEVQAKADEIEAERAAFADAYADAKAALLEVRQALGPVLGLQEAEESAAVMASRVAQLVARLQAPPPVPPADSAEIRTLAQRYQVAEARLNLVRRHLAPLLGIHEEDDGAPEMAFCVAGLVARLQAATPATGRNLEEELAGAVADLEMTDARLRAWELWHQESEGGGNPTLLAGLLRLTRGARA